jgi:putative oxidoreductase
LFATLKPKYKMKISTHTTILAIATIRIITGLSLAYHGLEVFDSTKIHEYALWDSIKDLPFPVFMTYLGKGTELIGGILLAIGFFTRQACLALAAIMLFICFKLGNGKFWYEDQHPFLYFLLVMLFFFLGSGRFSLDKD